MSCDISNTIMPNYGAYGAVGNSASYNSLLLPPMIPATQSHYGWDSPILGQPTSKSPDAYGMNPTMNPMISYMMGYMMTMMSRMLSSLNQNPENTDQPLPLVPWYSNGTASNQLSSPFMPTPISSNSNHDSFIKDVFTPPSMNANNHATKTTTHNSGNNNTPPSTSSSMDKSATQTSKATGNAPKMTYDSKPKAGNISTDGADYIVVIRSLGRTQTELDEGYFDSSGGTVVGTTGSKDKAMQLIDVKDVGSINLSDTNGTQILKIDTDGKALKLDNGTSGSNPLNGALDPDLGNSTNSIKRDGGSDFAIYADDESKFDDRVAKLKAGSSTSFYSGDDSAYILEDTTPVDVRGNGAIMQLSYA